MSSSPAPRVVAVGAIFIDDIVLPDGTTYMAQLGGGVVHAAMGAAMWGERPGLVALAGHDLPDSIHRYLEQHLDTTGLHFLDVPQIRAWQIFEADGTRRELYRVSITEPFTQGAQPEHLPATYAQSQGAYLLQDFEGIRAWRAAFQHSIIVWEPSQQIMVRGNHAQLRAALQAVPVDVISPNHAEAQAIYGIDQPEALVNALLEDGARAAALRMGPEGSLVASHRDGHPVHIPAVRVKVVDQTGAGNAFCGALLAGLVQGKSLHEAAAMGAVSASFCIEQQGILHPERVVEKEREVRYRQLVG